MYRGIYHSSQMTLTGCVKQFATPSSEKALFPPSVRYHCDLCNTIHEFRFAIAMTVNTPSQIKYFDQYCEDRHIEKDVTLTYTK